MEQADAIRIALEFSEKSSIKIGGVAFVTHNTVKRLDGILRQALQRGPVDAEDLAFHHRYRDALKDHWVVGFRKLLDDGREAIGGEEIILVYEDTGMAVLDGGAEPL